MPAAESALARPPRRTPRLCSDACAARHPLCRLLPPLHPALPGLRSKGNAVLFWDTKIGSMRQDKWSMHTGCPVLRGTKWCVRALSVAAGPRASCTGARCARAVRSLASTPLLPLLPQGGSEMDTCKAIWCVQPGHSAC